MTSYFIIPGHGDSGPRHWQTYFEQSGANFRRINQLEWESPDCHTWVQTIEQTVSMYDISEIVLVGHSLGCIAIAQWAHQFPRLIKGAFLVAPADVEAPGFSLPVRNFGPIPLEKLPFKSIVVASSNDPWMSLERSEYLAGQWGSEFENLGEAGHINAASGHGNWDEGLKLLKEKLG
ncbi:alpha/beta hydrolase [uncultured Chitinophaga sp.]|uniref:RBBP9/YdeN family alpha/beta hydrolase n=1 Tax=uncultured Chitinophaga sp. TaxID=339340 RepID=UPI0025FA5D91|nr:alpha/beta hydrolase [uncultured Chitinophaga sp.]